MKLEEFKKLYCKQEKRYDKAYNGHYNTYYNDLTYVRDDDTIYGESFRVFDTITLNIIYADVISYNASTLVKIHNEEDDVYLTWVIDYLKLK